jgi:hypothetical protein
VERIICLSSQYPRPGLRREAGGFVVSYLALLPMGFSVPPRLLLERWALTPPFHPYPRGKPRRRFIFCGTLRRSRFPGLLPRLSHPRKSGLRGIAPYGARTFLPGPNTTGPERFSALPKSSENIAGRKQNTMPQNSIRHSHVHVGRPEEDPVAIRAGDDFLVSLAGDHDGPAKLPVTASANTVLDADNH